MVGIRGAVAVAAALASAASVAQAAASDFAADAGAPHWIATPGPLDYEALYPTRAEIAGADGTVKLNCAIDAKGALVDCKVESQTPKDLDFGSAALRATSLFQADPKQPHHGRVHFELNWIYDEGLAKVEPEVLAACVGRLWIDIADDPNPSPDRLKIFALDRLISHSREAAAKATANELLQGAATQLDETLLASVRDAKALKARDPALYRSQLAACWKMTPTFR